MGKLGVANSGGGSEQRSGLGWRSPYSVPLIDDYLSAAEEAAQRVLNCVRPTLDSEEKRRDIVDYVQRLIKSHLNCEVFPYGSVPLKTYLPEGDIDLTALKSPNAEKSLAHDVLALLQKEEKNAYSEFLVKDTQFIDAEVQLVKCLVENIVIDISFNQLGGLSTLCFLEQVDRLIGRNNLFKRSIILVKTWCYYESRILGAHHGLISTYALETLVLYIFHLFHSSLNGPLAVLHKFLDYYSQFDWENYCISLKGPVCKSSLPDIVVSKPENGWDNLMLSKEFLENCGEMFSFTSRALEGKPKPFQAKHLNIIDPLKENNNLGRSVSKGNFYRIRSAFKYGSHKLSQALLQPKAKVADEINDFFSNTLSMHVNGNRSNKRLALELDDKDFLTARSSAIELLPENELLLKSSANDANNQSVWLEFNSEMEGYFTRQPPLVKSSGNYSIKQTVSSGGLNIGEPNDLSPSMSNLRNTSDVAPSSNSSTHLSWNRNHRPPSFYRNLSAITRSSGTGNSLQSDLASRKLGFNSSTRDTNGHRQMNGSYVQCMDSLQASFSDKFSLGFREEDLTSVGELESFNPLADLSGDYDSHIRSLLHGQLCHGFSLSASIMHHAQSSPSWIQVKNLRDVTPQPMPFWQCQSAEMSSYPLSKKSMCLDSDSMLPATVYHHEGTEKTVRTSTHSPNLNGFTKERSPLGRSDNEAPVKHNQSYRCQQTHGLNPGLGAQRNSKNSAHHVLPARGKSQGRGRLDTQCQSPPMVGDGNQENGSFNGSFRIQFGSIGNLGEEVLSASAADRSSFLGFSYEKQGTGAVMKQDGGKSS